jgi:RHS repeat-associated protein
VNGATAQTLTAILGTNTGDWIGDISTVTPDKSDIGGIYAGGAYSSVNFWHGILDEVRLSNVERSDDWVSTEYNNQSSPATFYTISSATGGTSQVHWLVTDHLGTPRMIVDQTGSLASVSRHDYLPFGEELFAETGGRTTSLGYTGSDGGRQQFTEKERDVETGLDYFGARYYSSIDGRFTSVDPGSFVPADPQNWNRYAYTQNNPLKFTDPTGKELYFLGDYADGIVADLEKFTGYKLIRDKVTGKVTIDWKQKRKSGKGTSYYLSESLRKAIIDSKVAVKIETVSESKNNVEVLGDSFTRKLLDIDDYNVYKRDSSGFAAAFLNHVITEYYVNELLPSSLDLIERFKQSHSVGLEAESETIGDSNGWWQVPRAEANVGAFESPPMISRFIYSTVEYDVVYKTGVKGRATQAEQVTKIDKTPKKPKK